MISRRLPSAVVLALVACIGCAHVKPSVMKVVKEVQVDPSTYIVAAPDGLEITIRPHITGGMGTELTKRVVVRPDGMITVDLVGDVPVEGLTPLEIDEKLTDLLSSYIKNVQITVAVVGFNSQRYFVVGEVPRQGQFPYTGKTTVKDAVAFAGSVTHRASLNSVRVLRGDPESPEIFEIRLRDILYRGDDSSNILLEPDDIVYVPPTAFATIGYAVDNILFPFRGLLGVATTSVALGEAD